MLSDLIDDFQCLKDNINCMLFMSTVKFKKTVTLDAVKSNLKWEYCIGTR